MIMRIFFCLIITIVLDYSASTSLNCCGLPLIFFSDYNMTNKHPVYFCGDGGKLEKKIFCGKGQCDEKGCNCDRGCRSIYPLEKKDIIGFFNDGSMICVATVLNTTHLRFSDIVSDHNHFQSSIIVPNTFGDQFTFMWKRERKSSIQATDELDNVFERSSRYIHHLDMKIEGFWKRYIDTGHAVKLNKNNLEIVASAVRIDK